jgi:hypothetical protein
VNAVDRRALAKSLRGALERLGCRAITMRLERNIPLDTLGGLGRRDVLVAHGTLGRLAELLVVV